MRFVLQWVMETGIFEIFVNSNWTPPCAIVLSSLSFSAHVLGYFGWNEVRHPLFPSLAVLSSSAFAILLTSHVLLSSTSTTLVAPWANQIFQYVGFRSELDIFWGFSWYRPLFVLRSLKLVYALYLLRVYRQFFVCKLVSSFWKKGWWMIFSGAWIWFFAISSLHSDMLLDICFILSWGFIDAPTVESVHSWRESIKGLVTPGCCRSYSTGGTGRFGKDVSAKKTRDVLANFSCRNVPYYLGFVFGFLQSGVSGTIRRQPFGRQNGVGHMGDKSVDQMGWSNWSVNWYIWRG